jgi:acyl-CoA synthetase (AMP-forming)/AMP-acid ligase II
VIDRIRTHSGPALLDPERGLTLDYAAMMGEVEGRATALRDAVPGRGLVFLAMGPEVDAVLSYLACLAAELPVCLVEPHVAPLARLLEAYAPHLLIQPAAIDAPRAYRRLDGPAVGDGYTWWRHERDQPYTLHPDLALLLTTSGSTGSPKLVRLTRANLEANARSIADYLGLGPEERAIQSLPSHYSYGLSVLNSHLWAGGSVALTPHSFMRREFWSAVDAARCTSFAGVPYMYETLHRLRFTPSRHAQLRTLTQAGGALRPDLIAHFHEIATASAARLVVMYGQTEATARISYVPPDRLGEKIGSIGIAIPDGALSLSPVEGSEGMQELVYRGPNVMMGYAEQREDLALGDVQRGTLRTGDLGRADADGFHYVLGRLKRFAKLFGRRVSLEDVERELEASLPLRAAALDGGDRIVIHVVEHEPVGEERVRAHLARYLGVPPAAFGVRFVDVLPQTAAGKKDYRALEALE